MLLRSNTRRNAVKDEQRYLSDKYLDLLHGEPDPDLLRLINGLEGMAASYEPPERIAESIENALMEKRGQVAAPALAMYDKVLPNATPKRELKLTGKSGPSYIRRAPWRPATRFGWAVVLMALLVGGGAVASIILALEHGRTQQSLSAVSPSTATPVQPLTGPYVGVEHLEAAGLGQKVNLSQTVNGYTVTIDWVYADGNQVILRHNVSPSHTEDGLRIGVGPMKLTDATGKVFPNIGSIQVHTRDWASPLYAMFDASHYSGTPGAVSVPATASLRLITGLGASRSPSESRKTATPATMPASWERRTLPETFTFDFKVPVMPVRVAQVGKAVTADGATVTLEELRVSPSEARTIVRLEPPKEDADLEWRPTLYLEVGDWDEDLGIVRGDRRYHAGPSSQPLGGGRWSYSWPVVPYDRREEWTVTVTQLIGYAPGLVPEVVLDGPWTFKATLP
jgi:hypothetical protein